MKSYEVVYFFSLQLQTKEVLGESDLTIQLIRKSPCDVIGIVPLGSWQYSSLTPCLLLPNAVIRGVMRTPTIVNEKRDLCP